MREETLKRLDALIEGINKLRTDPYSHDSLNWNDVWLALRTELAAERCDACRWWRGTSGLGHIVQRCAYIDTLMYPDACCSHFEKKEPTA